MPDPDPWIAVREFAMDMPGAWEDHPWDETVVKVGTKVFVFLGRQDTPDPGMSVKLTDSQDHALSMPKAEPTGYGLGRHGWVSMPFAHRDLELLCDWVEESYRNVAGKRLIAELDARED